MNKVFQAAIISLFGYGFSTNTCTNLGVVFTMSSNNYNNAPVTYFSLSNNSSTLLGYSVSDPLANTWTSELQAAKAMGTQIRACYQDNVTVAQNATGSSVFKIYSIEFQ
jgi:hypothetical protein